jgi:hypothetical protein
MAGRSNWKYWMVLVAVVVAILAPTVYVLLDRLDDQVLTIIATIGCAAGISLPTLLAVFVVLTRRAENANRREDDQQPRGQQFTQPVLMMVPPMALPQQPTMQVPTTLTREPVSERRFTIVGEE